VSDPFQASESYYQGELSAGVERFLEPRRDTCPWCGSTDLSIRLRTTDLIQRKPGRFTLEQCQTCQHIFQNPRLTPAGLDFYYRDFYDGLGRQMAEGAFNAAGRSYRGRIEMLRAFTTPKAWLDVGAGYGHFCQRAREVWPNTVFAGLDLSVSVEEAQRRGWIDRSYRGEFVALADELAGHYDVVSMHHYLEHTREPFDELDTAAKILPSGGYLLIELPDPQSLLGRIFGRWWMPWFQPQHQHLIPVNNLVQALANRGFSSVSIEHGAAHQYVDLFLSLLLVLIAIAPDPSLPWSKTTPARWRQLRHATVWSAGRPLLLIAYLLDQLVGRVIRRTRGGNTYRVLARKDS
jgi:SAM-dependent methyltransferase